MEKKVEVSAGSGMIAFYVPEQAAEALALDSSGAEEPKDLHVTLAYFPSATEYREEILRAASNVAVDTPPLHVRIAGDALFTAEGGDRRPYVLLADSPEFVSARSWLCALLPDGSYSEKHGFIPHITLDYLEPMAARPESLESYVEFDVRYLTAIIDGERFDFQLKGSSRGSETAVPAATKVDSVEGVSDHMGVLPLVETQLSGDENMTLAEKAVWSTAYVNDLPDSSFLFVEAGDKDGEGKTTPRSKRHFPYKDANGSVDLPHLRNAIARIPQSNAPGLTPEKKQALQDRARRMLATSNKAGRRMGSGMLGKLRDAMSTMMEVMDWAGYQDAEEQGEGEKVMETPLYIFKTEDDGYRWIAYSSNAFKDRQDEIVSTKALEDAVMTADAEEDKGPLLLWHTPSARVGKCDFQAVHGRFLIESGTFDNTLLAEKALDYLATTDDVLGMSIGFAYPEPGGKVDGVYTQIRIVERSICPIEVAANPWTAFNTLKGAAAMKMSEDQQAWLEKATSAELVQGILAGATKASEDLEAAAVAFKAGTARKDGEAKADAPDDKPDDGEGEGEGATATAAGAESAPAEGEKAVAITPELVAATIAKALEPIAESMKTIGETMVDSLKTVNERFEKIEAKAETDAQKTDTPRAADVFRATKADGNVVEDETAKKAVGDAQPPPDGSPIAPYVSDLLAKGALR